jgi:RNA polymerase sigma-70 factor (ECF subfamily)
VEAERALVERAAGGDGAAFETLVLRYQDRVYGLALRLTGAPEEAEDVTQEAFLRAYKGLAAFGGRSSFYTWLFRITFNAAHSEVRRLGRRHEREKVLPIGAAADEDDDARQNPGVADPPSREADPAAAVETADSAERVRRAIDGLEPDHRAVVVLRDVEGLSYEEIAEVVGASRAAVKSRIHRARETLASRLKDLLP